MSTKRRPRRALRQRPVRRRDPGLQRPRVSVPQGHSHLKVASPRRHVRARHEGENEQSRRGQRHGLRGHGRNAEVLVHGQGRQPGKHGSGSLGGSRQVRPRPIKGDVRRGLVQQPDGGQRLRSSHPGRPAFGRAAEGPSHRVHQ